MTKEYARFVKDCTDAIKLFLTINVQFRVSDDDKSNLKEK